MVRRVALIRIAFLFSRDSRWVMMNQRMDLPHSLRTFVASLAFMGGAFAEHKPPSTEEALEELRSAFGKNDGYLVTYESKGENKALKYALGVDPVSGLTASDLEAVKGDKKMSARLWNTDDDRLYYSTDGELFITCGLREELECFERLGKVFASGKIQPVQASQYLLLSKDSLEAGFRFTNSGNPPWQSNLEGSRILAADEKSITFETVEVGLLTISRETGMLIRQTIKGSQGEDRILELTEFKRNPGRQGIEAMSRDWSTLGAKEKNLVFYTAPVRLRLIQAVIDSVESGGADLGNLEKSLEEHQELLRNLAEMCAARAGDSPLAVKLREVPLPDKQKIKAHWLARVPGAKADDEQGFEQYLLNPELRQGIREGMIKPLLASPGAMEKLMPGILGERVWPLIKTKDEAGQAAKDLFGKAMLRSYLELMIDRRMNQMWGRPDQLD